MQDCNLKILNKNKAAAQLDSGTAHKSISGDKSVINYKQ